MAASAQETDFGVRSATGGPSESKRFRWLVLGGIVAASVVAVLLIVALASARRDPSTLTETQWNRLQSALERTLQRAAGAEPEEQGRTVGESLQSGGNMAVEDRAGVSPGAPAAGPEARPAGQEPRRAPRPLQDAEVLARQAEAYAADRAKNIVELQPFRHSLQIDVEGEGGRRGTATLINLNPRVNTWYLLRLSWAADGDHTYHLANADPEAQSFTLDPDYPLGLVIDDGVEHTRCDLWSVDAPWKIEVASESDSPYVDLCDDRVTLRLRATGRKTRMERVTDFLRDSVWGGETITVFVRQTFFQDAYLHTAELADGTAVPATRLPQEPPGMPRAARLAPDAEEQLLTPTGLGLVLDNDVRGRVAPGRWYGSRGNPGIFVSAMRPDLVAPEILESHLDVVVRLDDVEAGALAYLVAFDLEQFDIGFALGTDHPRVGWSDRVPLERRTPGLPGPDGIDTVAPLVSTGIVPPALAPSTVATFTGGFKRTHGAFRYGELATTNKGSHYGFIENGVIYSKLHADLSTIYVLDDGTFGMKTWTEEDDALLERVRFARQNGVPIIETDPGSGVGVPGAWVSRYGPGNWSGSQDGRYRTLRAGACLQDAGQKRFLIYAYFSSATPSAMARVFQAYGCRYAMLLDMNALEHTYLAIYWLRGTEFSIQHLVEGMSVLDRSEGGRMLPRFLGFADNRDFFYVMRRPAGQAVVRESEP